MNLKKWGLVMVSNNERFQNIYNNVVKGGYDFGTGSWAVVNDNVKMKLDDIGEFHPYISSGIQVSDNDLKKFKESCLSTSSKNEDDVSRELYSKVPGINYDKRLGFYSGLYIGHVVEKDFRKNGSSGGFGTWILEELMNTGLIDYVINVVPTGNNDKLFEYRISNNIESLEKGAKTKYYPVEFSEVINTLKKIPGKYAIVGLPSFIMELRLLSDLDPVIKDRVKFTIGLVCGHQKSAKFSEFLAWQCGIEPGNLTSINFRKKLIDSLASQYAIEVKGEVNGKTKTITRRMSELVGSDWGEALFKVRASDFTDDVMNETADITLGDAWLPEYTKDSKGNNIIIVRNHDIQSLIDNAIKDGRVKLDKTDVETIFSSQAAHYRHTRIELRYRLYKKDKEKKWYPNKRESPSPKLPWIRKRIQDEREKICLTVPSMYLEATKKNDLGYFLKKISRLRNSYKNTYKLKRVLSKIKRVFK